MHTNTKKKKKKNYIYLYLIAIYKRDSELYLEVPVLPLISSYWENKLYKKSDRSPNRSPTV